MYLTNFKRSFLFLISFFLCIVSVQASTYPLGDSGWTIFVRSEINSSVTVSNIALNNDAVTLEIERTFSPNSFDGHSFLPIQFEFIKTSAYSIPKIIIQNKYFNNTGQQWNALYIDLMVNQLNPQAAFNPAVSPNGGQLENVFYSNNVGFNSLPIKLSFEDVDGIGIASNTYLIGNTEIITKPDIPIGTRLGLKDTPMLTPEPLTIALLSFGSLFIKRKNWPIKSSRGL